MDDIEDSVPPTQDEATFRSLFEDTRPSLILLGIIFAVSLVVLAIVWWLDASHNTLGFELAKTCMQVAGVTVIGAIVGIATFTYQHKRERAAKDRDQKLEDWRRDNDTRRDERRRQDDLLRSILGDTIGAYHAVKRARRLLKAEVGPSQQVPMSFEVYDQYIKSIIDEQLEFETLTLVAGAVDDSRLPRTPPWPSARPKDKDKPPLVAMFSKIEDSLQELVREYERSRHEVKQAGDMSLAQLPKARQYLTTSGFYTGMKVPMDEVVKLLQRALLEPLLFPAVRAENDDGQA